MEPWYTPGPCTLAMGTPPRTTSCDGHCDHLNNAAMIFAAGTVVQCSIQHLSASYKAEWSRKHLGRDDAAAVMTGRVVEQRNGWVIVAFPNADRPMAAPARVQPTALTRVGDGNVPDPQNITSEGQSSSESGGDARNRRMMVEASMVEEEHAGEDDPPADDYGDLPPPPRQQSWATVGTLPGQRQWSCPRQMSSASNCRHGGIMRLGCPPETVGIMGFFNAFFPTCQRCR